MVVNMVSEVDGTPILSGAASGRAALSMLLSKTAREPSAPEPVFLDFQWVEVATASFLRECVLTFRDFVRRRKSTFYPVVANANDSVREELGELVRGGDVLMTCTLDADGNVTNAAPIGQLDPKQRLTLDLVLQHGETDAGDLMRRYGKQEGTKYSTAWNNRLANLAELGFVVELSQGRTKRYRPLFGGLSDGR
jgi:hypothetical protein